ncbi:MAG: urease accessory protein UreE [Firmicutes bacterium]|jgi:urease accessory protein|uniref:Urease accessory protein UreE n=1 Tax=Sulfobacillus benefaciens TaxID=453960 RepID=A0A2T2X0J1_9FIRM|nr:urease accessory protein UreE [Bacillota bacterium]PSR28003.1 MAG: hypothetical protein C7B43_10625 [Sulfobacillus benefaciens]
METVTVNRVLGSYLRTGDDLCKEVEWVDMDHDHCGKARWKALSDKGRVVLIDLPRKVRLADKDVLYEDETRVIVARVKPEQVLVMRPRTIEEMGALCYHIGNLHQPCWVNQSRVFTPNESFLKDLAQSMAVPFSEEEQILPQGFATRHRTHAAP